MIYSTRLMAFINVEKPQEMNIVAPEIVQGMSVIIPKDNDFVIFRKYIDGKNFSEIEISKIMNIGWGYTLSENKNKVIFIPFLHYRYSRGGKAEEISKLVFAQLKIKPMEVDLPEKVIKLSKPDWVDVEAEYDYPNCSATGKVAFISEARELISEFEIELGKIKEELK